jgi:hypothetical protein
VNSSIIKQDTRNTGNGTRGTGRRRTLAAGTLAAVFLGLGLGACGSDDSGGNAAGSTPAASVDTAMKYAECMRSNGIASFPDPVDGGFKLKVTKGGELDPDTSKYQTAASTCKEYAPAGLGGGEQSADEQEQTLKWAQCMRKNGVENFPDPVDGRIMITRDQVDTSSAAFQKAEEACQELAPAGGALPPGGPIG